MTGLTTLDIALASFRAGHAVVPPKQDGSKRPETERVPRERLTELLGEDVAASLCGDEPYAYTWKHWQVDGPSEALIRQWYGNGREGNGVVTGAISKHLELFEFDDLHAYTTFCDTAEALGYGDLIEQIRNGYEELTPGGGVHWFWYCEPAGECQKLAQRPGPPDQHGRPTIQTLIEMKAEGGFAIHAPSRGSVHPTGGSYEVLSGSITTIARITPAERQCLIDLARTLDEMPKRDYVPVARPTSSTSADDRPGDDFDRRATWLDVLEPHGWACVSQRGQTEYWKRPGTEHRWSATINGPGVGADRLYVFSSSTPFEPQRSYSKFQAFAILNHAGDFAAAARDLGGRGYGEQLGSPRSAGIRGAFVGNGSADFEEQPWPIRQPLPPELPSVPTLPATLIPASLQPWLVDIADRAAIPLEYPSIPAIVGLGAVVGRSLGIRASRFDDYLIVPNLWGAIIGRPGWMKSYAVSEPLKPLSRLAHEARERYAQDSAAAEDRADRLKAEINGIKQAIAAAAKSGKSAPELADKLAAKKAELRDCAVIERRYMTQDATVEKLGELLLQNPRGLLVMRDELAGWLRTLDKPGREGDREFFLEGWNGNAGYTFDRIGRGTIPIPAVTISIVGGIQPGKLRGYIAAAMSEGSGADGLLQRLQLLVWPDALGEWKTVNRWPDTAAKDRANAVFRALDNLHPSAIGAMTDDGSIPFLRFSDDAQFLHDDWKQELENRLRASDLTSTPAFESHLSKYRSLMPSLALLFHLVAHAADGAGGPVSLDAARLGAAWCDYLECHARKVFHAELNPSGNAAHLLAAKIIEGAVTDQITVRDIDRMQWTGLTTADRVRAGLEMLAILGWLRLETVATGGRASELVRLHPDIRSGSGG